MDSSIERVVELAGRAPSVHNTQPWAWHARGGVLELYVDRSRRLALADPDGRNLMISCGAALHHAQVAARALGWRPVVTRLQDPADPDALARVELEPAAPPRGSDRELAALDDRCTDRRRFTSWPIPAERLHALAAAARLWGGHAVPVTDASDRVRIELLVSRALDCQRDDASITAEQGRWIDHGPHDGIPAAAVPRPVDQSGRPDRFGVPLADSALRQQRIEGCDGVLVLCGDDDEPAWLRTGEALSALWLAATLDGLSVVPLSQVVEVAETRVALHQTLLGGLTTPHLLVRIGWQSIGRGELTRTPRRPLADVLVTAPSLSGT